MLEITSVLPIIDTSVLKQGMEKFIHTYRGSGLIAKIKGEKDEVTTARILMCINNNSDIFDMKPNSYRFVACLPARNDHKITLNFLQIKKETLKNKFQDALRQES